MLPRVALLVALAVLAEGLHSPLGKQFPKKSQRVASGVGGDALFLTPYIKSGDLETARSLSKVNMPAVGVTTPERLFNADPCCLLQYNDAMCSGCPLHFDFSEFLSCLWL